ncbi:MAG: hypothetical protein HY245_03525 [Rhizobiales bacterium]|nr:hypothetical protein [Hyphomicrobiales bacterium]MBI3672494.1 hypothetical protein [Hyphomicrobiales bacterium]
METAGTHSENSGQNSGTTEQRGPGMVDAGIAIVFSNLKRAVVGLFEEYKLPGELWGYFKKRTNLDENIERFIGKLRSSSKQFKTDSRLLSDVFQLNEPTNTHFVLGNAHPNYDKSDVHPAHNESMQPFREYMRSQQIPAAQANDLIFAADMLDLDDTAKLSRFLAKNLVVFGSPISNHLPRLLFDYAESEASPGTFPLSLRSSSGSPFDLRFEFILDQETILADFPIDQRYTITRNGSKILNWGILDNDQAKRSQKRYVVPCVSGSIVEIDYLLLTSTPNVFSGGTTRILNIAGCHGMGTAATELLFNDNKVMRNIAEQTKNFGAWQCLIPIKKSSDSFLPGHIQFDGIRYGRCELKKTSMLRNTQSNVKKYVSMLTNRKNDSKPV